MTIKDKILLNLEDIRNPSALAKILGYIQQFRQSKSDSPASNQKEVLQFAGVLKDEEADDMLDIINAEFNNIEGDW